jgi:hypothetical protein
MNNATPAVTNVNKSRPLAGLTAMNIVLLCHGLLFCLFMIHRPTTHITPKAKDIEGKQTEDTKKNKTR